MLGVPLTVVQLPGVYQSVLTAPVHRTVFPATFVEALNGFGKLVGNERVSDIGKWVSKPDDVLGATVDGRGAAKAQIDINTQSTTSAVERKPKVIL